MPTDTNSPIGPNDGIAECTCETARHILDSLDVTGPAWSPHGSSDCNWVFRGHGDARWWLRPSAWREDQCADTMNRARNFLKLEEGPVGQTPEGAAFSWCEQGRAERFLVKEFAIVAERHGLRLPLDVPPTDWESLDPGDEHELTCLGQHYGIPTPLLDFTRDPHVALYWACQEPETPGSATSTPESSQGPATHLSVTALDLGRWEALGVKPIVGRRALNEHLHRQDGVLLKLVGADEQFHDTGMLPYLSIPDAAAIAARRFVLPRTGAQELLRLLYLRGVSEASVRPGFDSVAKVVKWRLRSQE